MRLLMLVQAATPELRRGVFPRPGDEAEGRSLVLAAHRVWPKVSAVLVAPTRAAEQTVSAVAATLQPERPPRPCAALADAAAGEWAGRSLDAVADAEPASLERWLGDPRASPPGGDSAADVLDRVGRWLRVLAQQETGTVLAVAPAAAVRAAIVTALESPVAAMHGIEVAPLTLLRLDWRERWRLVSLQPASGALPPVAGRPGPPHAEPAGPEQPRPSTVGGG
ncbi:histidine phosphatase family protein [Rhizosaccharibacter radicis]|uniref:Histidine phosphatase family protein n=1 Tax=Rhizosaccharibacter radicis TaxID=2782605 RepID=A0ABT1W125_9PROT|nr:histidine phosphatase family protein [Acetobacteraceae bacterium KSS12]